jgi:antitoxin component YwqK of YwqJK toxin-antitoxin module
VKRIALLLLCVPSACLVQHPLPDAPAPTAAHDVRRSAYPDGTPRSETRLIVWSDGRVERDGAEREYHKSGALVAERFFSHDRHVGTWRTWYPDGTVRSEVDFGSAADAPAMQRFWHPTGTLAAEGPLREGRRDGRWRYSDEAGRLQREGGYRDGKRDGPWTFYRADGSREAEGSYALGERVGEWVLVDELGVEHVRAASDPDLDDP